MSFPADFPRPKMPTLDRVLRDYEDPRSVVNLVTPDLEAKITALPSNYVDRTEEDLLTLLDEPDATTSQLRQMFWLEYDRAASNGTLMSLTQVYTGVCSRKTFAEVCNTPKKLAWILNPPKDYLAEIDELHYSSLKQMREILKLKNINREGYVDNKLIETKVKIFLALDMRKKGGYIQRSMQLNQNINKNETTLTIESNGGGGSTPVEALNLDERIKQLEQEIKNHEQKELSAPEPSTHLSDLQKKTVEPLVLSATYKEVNDDEKNHG